MQIPRIGAISRRLAPAALLLALTSLFACKQAEPPAQLPPRAQILQNLPLIPLSKLVDTTGTPEAEHRGYTVILPFDSTSKFYPDTLRKLGWSIEGLHQGDRSLDIYARKNGQNLWVRLEGEIAQLGDFTVNRTNYTLTAAAVSTVHDSTTPPQPMAPRHARPEGR